MNDNTPTGTWIIRLDTGTRIPFYTGLPDTNPFETEPEFDHGEYWSIDADPCEYDELIPDPDESGFSIIPKKQVVETYFENFSKDHPGPEIVWMQTFSSIKQGMR